MLNISTFHLLQRSATTLSMLVLFGCGGKPESHILVFSKTAGYRHASIPEAHQAIRDIGRSIGVEIDSTEEASMFTDDGLNTYDLVIFAMTTGDVLDDTQQVAFERFIREGGGFLGIHSASDTEYDWEWYGKLVGGYFDGHPPTPNVRTGRLIVEDAYHPSTNHLRFQWTRDDEWYDVKDQNPDVNLLISIVDSTYKDEWEEDLHPISWYHVYDGGRAFFTAMGHTPESYHESAFVQHLRGGIEYTLGLKDLVPEPPAESSFTREIFVDSLNEPMELDVLPDGRIAFIQRHGEVLLFDPASDTTSDVGHFDVSTEGEDGLLGFALDPGFAENGWMYFYYSPSDSSLSLSATESGDSGASTVTINRLSRFEFDGSVIVPESEIVMLEIPVFRGCCHSGGSIEFDGEGNLYLSTGDDTNPFASAGHSPHDDRPDRDVWNAQRSAANTNDLRGKILRITPRADGSYAVPEGNLTSRYDIEAPPEIYTMGHRNPFRMSVDARTGYVYWGDIGPDADDDSERGPRGYDEIGQAREAGNFGWPYFIADNKAYRSFDFETNQMGDWFDPTSPVNKSRLNTGSERLPPAQPAMIWYPYGDSEDFPMLLNGPRSAMAGPVFHRDDYLDTDARFPKLYDGKLFIYDWMRHWIKVVTLDHAGTLLRIEDFMPSTSFNRPMDMVFGPDGALYLLEYGTIWAAPNPEARLSKISFSGS